MSVLTVRSKTRAEAVSDVEAAVRAMFAAIERKAPEHVRCASCRLADGTVGSYRLF